MQDGAGGELQNHLLSLPSYRPGNRSGIQLGEVEDHWTLNQSYENHQHLGKESKQYRAQGSLTRGAIYHQRGSEKLNGQPSQGVSWFL